MSSVCTYFIWLFQSFSEWRDGRKGRIAQSASVLRRGNEAAGIFSHSVRLRSQTCTSSSSTLSLIAKTNERLYILYFQTSPLDCAIATLRFKLSGSCYETVERLRLVMFITCLQEETETEELLTPPSLTKELQTERYLRFTATKLPC